MTPHPNPPAKTIGTLHQRVRRFRAEPKPEPVGAETGFIWLPPLAPPAPPARGWSLLRSARSPSPILVGFGMVAGSLAILVVVGAMAACGFGVALAALAIVSHI